MIHRSFRRNRTKIEKPVDRSKDEVFKVVSISRDLSCFAFFFLFSPSVALIKTFPVNEVAVDLWSNTIAME